MSKRKRHIEIVPVWRKSVDQRLLLQALLSFVAQLEEEAKPTTDVEPDPGEVSND